jgi:2-polyprenyl-3-methyl-5-hydroxy-6-metoxy-1,4-benzoquinol methylase
MDRQFLDDYFKMEREHWWFRVREGIILDQFRSSVYKGESMEILNVGAATGRSSEMLEPFGNIQSIEYDEPSFQFCRDELKMKIDQGSITELPYPDNAYDCVCAFDVVEHVEDHQKAMSELFRVCKPGGKIFITVPAFMSLWSNHDVVNHHFRRYRKQQMLDLFSANGGRLLRSTYFNFFLFIPIFLVRSLQRIFTRKKQKELKPDNDMIESGFINTIFHSIFSFERSLLKKMSFPFGVSLMVVWEKK